jgi:hypothetical protein
MDIRRFLCLIPLLLPALGLLAPDALAQAQRMRIPPGTYKIATSGTRVAARCLDRSRHAPQVGEAMTHAAGLVVTRIVDGVPVQRPLTDAIQAGWVRVDGQATASSLNFRALLYVYWKPDGRDRGVSAEWSGLEPFSRGVLGCARQVRQDVGV